MIEKLSDQFSNSSDSQFDIKLIDGFYALFCALFIILYPFAVTLVNLFFYHVLSVYESSGRLTPIRGFGAGLILSIIPFIAIYIVEGKKRAIIYSAIIIVAVTALTIFYPMNRV